MGRRSFGKYRLVEKIAIGGMAEVWRAKQTVVEGVERDVVIKRILPHFVNDPDFVQMFLNEARVAARFNHSNVAQIYDVGEVKGAYFIAMEYVAGADLGRVMRKAWSMGHWVARPLAMRILACCCEGLAYAHTRNDEQGKPLRVVHRDISPANILISVDGAVKLTDFGIAKASDLVSVTKAGSIKGKFAYMSPEQACGKPLDHRSDLYSAALVLYELLTGIRPLRRDTDAETHAAAVQGEIQAPSEVSDVPAELDSLVMKALAKRPQDRYPDVHAFRMALEEFLVDQRWVATSSQIAELMRILFPDGIRPELPPGVSSEDDFPELGLEDTHHRAAKITAPSRRPSLAERPPAGTDPANFEEEPEEEAAPRRDLYGEEDPLPDQDPALRVSGGFTAPAPKIQWSGPPRRLDFVEGPDEGMVVRLTAARLVVGRVADCHVNLKDRSISRRHLELSQSDEGVMLRDLASGNGTRVNGESITDRLLRHGDLVELGNTRFKFIDEEEDQRLADAQISAKLALEGRKPPPVPSPPQEAEPPPPGAEPLPELADPTLRSRWDSLPRRARQVVIGAGGAVLLLGGGLCVGALGPASPEPKQELAQRRLVQARAALAEGRREEAAAMAASAERLWPGSDEEGLGLRARRDQDAAERLRKAELALVAGELDAATAVLAEAKPAAPELSSQKQALLGRVEAARQRNRELAFAEALSGGDFLRARALLTGFSGVQATQLGARLQQAERQASLEVSNREAMAAEARVEDERRAKEAHAARVEALFRTVDLRLQARDYARAVLAADHVVDANQGDEDVRARAQLLKRVIPSFGRAYDQAELEERNGQHERAARSLRRTRELLRELGFGGALAETLQRHQVETNLAAARRAVEEKRLTDAALLYREAARLAPRDRRAQDGLRALAPVADDLYREAQVIKVTSPNQAQDRLRTVVAITDPDSALHGRAKKALRELNRLTSDEPE